MPSSWQWQGAGQAGRPGPGWGSLPERADAHSAAQSHSARSPGGLSISAAAGCGAPGGRSDGRAHGACVCARLTSWSRAGPEGCAVGGHRPPLDLAWTRRLQQRRDGAVREGQALLSDLRYSVSRAGLDEGGRHRGVGGGVKETFYAAARSPSLLPSQLAGISSGAWGGRGDGEESKETQRKLGTASTRHQRPALV